MSNPQESSSQLSPLKRAYLAIEKMEAKLKTMEHAAREPIAIIGVGCRFPGEANDTESFWKLLHNGVDAVIEVPADRWDIDAFYSPDEKAPGKMSTRQGGFLSKIDQFDPQFFGIAPREAISMDPQQRLLLEVAWEALENAGQAPDKLSGSRTGVFIGIINNDYRQLKLETSGITEIDSYYSSGIAQSMASGRLSYVLGLQGPSISVDTACSSSLVSVHLACQSLRSGESRMALAGGVNLILMPELSVAFSKYQMLSADGRCKTFDSRADGFGRGEGCGLIVLKRLSDALADGDNILALILGTAVNQDGPSSGLTAPNGPSQESVIREALANAGLKPSEITYVEAHGTGTSLGDPIEIQALGSVFGKRDTNQPLMVGSVKTNFGHLEGAAGIAGLIKAALALHHRTIPPHLHLQELNPLIPWAELPITIPTQPTPWPENSSLHAGVSAFGFSGTNAHIILGAAPEQTPVRKTVDQPKYVLKLSTKSENTLRELAQRYHQHLSMAHDEDMSDICFSANVGRANQSHRLSVVADSRKDALEKLTAFVSSSDIYTNTPGLTAGRVKSVDPPKIAFLFTGQGSQYISMGKQLYDRQSAFRQTVDKCAEILQPYLQHPLLDVLFINKSDPLLINETEYTQPALFVLEYALAELWRSWGIKPSVVMGHSVGEYVAACIASVFSLEDGLKLIAERGRLMQALPSGGQMAALFSDQQHVEEILSSYEGQVSIAAINGPQNIVISGEKSSVQAITGILADQGIKSQLLTVSHAFHSHLMEPMLSDFEKIAAGINYSTPKIKFISNVSGQLAMGNTVSHASYWRDHVRKSVQFETSMKTAQSQGIKLFLEVGPNPVLLEMGKRCLPDTKQDALWLPSLARNRNESQIMFQSLSEMYVYGVDVDWVGISQIYGQAHRLRLPTSPFERKRYWIADKPQREPSRVASATVIHPLLGHQLRSALTETQFECRIATDSLSFLNDHRIHGLTIMPGTAFIEIGLAVADALFKDKLYRLADLTIQEPLIVPDDSECTIQVIVTPEKDNSASYKVFSLQDKFASPSDELWILNASGTIVAEEGEVTPSASEPLVTIQNRCSEETTADEHYQVLAKLGLEFGPSLHGVEQIWRQPAGGEALGKIHLPKFLETEADRYQIHPALLDACLQILSAAMPASNQTELYMPVGLDRFQVYVQLGTRVWSHAKIELRDSKINKETYSASVHLLSETGEVLAEATGLLLKRASIKTLMKSASQKNMTDWLYQVQWQPQPLQLQDSASLGYLATPAEVASQVQPLLSDFNKKQGVEQYQALLPHINELSTQYILFALQQLGWESGIGQKISADALVERFGILDLYSPLINRFLDILGEDGILQKVDTGWAIDQSLENIHLKALRAQGTALLAQNPLFESELTLLTRCGPQLAEVLTGVADPLELLFPGGDLTLAEKLYQESPLAHAYNGLVQSAVTAALRRVPIGSELRILEIGAGTGGTTSYVLPSLPIDRTEYVFTDMSQAFLSKARRKFDKFGFVDYQLLDIEKSPQNQGYQSHRYDLVIAANVVHATSDLRTTLKNVQQLLVPGGHLLMVEITSLVRWIDLTFGLTEGWWKFTDADVRQSYPLLRQEAWQKLLAEVGFSKTMVVEPALGNGLEQALILAQYAPSESVLPDERTNWLIFADQVGVGEELADTIRSRGDRCVLVSIGDDYTIQTSDHFHINPTKPEDFKRLFAEWAESNIDWHGVIHMWSLDASLPEAMDAGSLQTDQRISCGSGLYLLQSIVNLDQETPPRLWLVTRGAQSANGLTSVSIGQSSLWGLGKTIILEHPELRCTMIDLDPANNHHIQHLYTEVCSESRENQVALQKSGRFVARLTKYTPTRPEPVLDNQPVSLVATERGILDNLTLHPVTRRRPDADEVEIRVRATGLNFRDVLNALDLYPGDPGPLGGECAGEITAVGKNITRFKVGDRVMGVVPGCFGTFVTASANLVVQKPDHLDDEEAATILIPYLTAHYTLNYLGKMTRGEKVLIHAAAGGVGLAAVRLAQQVGAEIFATAGSPEKRAYLKALGIQHVLDSRSLNFSDEITQITSGRGVDLVLNSLADEFCMKSLSVLAERGRFLEIGKRGILSEDAVKELKPDVSYFIVDWSETNKKDPALMQGLLFELMDVIKEESLAPLPRRTFSLDNAVNAFRFMSQAKHIGKIVITQQKDIAPNTVDFTLRAKSSYLITGGFGGLGLVVARWMVEKGARHLALMGRHTPTDASLREIEGIEELGAQVMVMQADVTVPEQVAGVIRDIESGMPPLRGVIHAAGVLDNGVLLHQDWLRFSKVLAPKVAGSWNLHNTTKNLPLDFFVMFSSIASLIGSRGQGNHTAANMFMDMLAYYRRAQGLPGLSLNWGAWSETGAAVKQGASEWIVEQGMRAFTPEEGLQIMETLLSHSIAQVGIAPMNWSVFMRQFNSSGNGTEFFSELTDGVHINSVLAEQPRKRETEYLLTSLEEAPANKRKKILLTYIQEEARKVLGLDTGQEINDHVPLSEMGLDSLMAVELRNVLRVGLDLKRTLPATLVFDYPTVGAIADYLMTQINLSDTNQQDEQLAKSNKNLPAEEQTMLSVLDTLEDLSEEEVEQLYTKQMMQGNNDNE